MKRIINLILIFCCFATQNIAQDFNNDYQPLKSQGEIPKAILTTSSEKYESDKEEISREDKRSTRKDKDKFYLQNNFIIDEMMKSGQVLFNDPLSVYVNKVADKLLAHNPKLRNELEFYVIRSAAVNAFATDRGTIFVNIGLLARLEDESQLAFVLAHEIVHYQEQHNIQTYVEYAEIERGSSYRRSKSYEQLLEKNNYSKSLETEADKLGLDIFLKSNYSTKTIRGVFDILEKAHVPYTNVVFNNSFLHTPDIQFPEIYTLKEIKEIEVEESNDEESEVGSTHPSVRERRSDLLLSISGKDNANKEIFLISETDFKNIREIARFEICSILLQSQRYTSAIYHVYALLKTYPNNAFLRKTLAKSLYGLAQYKNADRFDEVMPYSFENYQGEIQQVYHLFEKMEAEELNVLAAVYCWKVHQEFPESKGLEYTAKDMIEDLVIYQIEEPFEFFRKERPADLPVNDVSFAKFGLGKLIENETIKEWLTNGEKYRKEYKENKEFYKTSKGKKAYNKEQRKEANKGKYLAIDKAVFINPNYLKIDARKKTPYQYIKSEERQKEFEGWITDNGNRLDMKTDILDINQIPNKSEIEIYQDVVVMMNWIDEYMTNDMFMINSNYDEAIAITEKYGTDVFCYAGAISYRGQSNALLIYAGAAYMFFFPPLGISYFIRSTYEVLHFNIVFDVRQNKKLLTNVNLANYKDKDIIIQQNLYWSMLQMKRKESDKSKK